MNITEYIKIMKYIEKEDLDGLKKYIEKEKDKYLIKKEEQYTNGQVKTLKSFMYDPYALCFLSGDKKILSNSMSIYLLKDLDIVKKYNEWVKESKMHCNRELPIIDNNTNNSGVYPSSYADYTDYIYAINTILRVLSSFEDREYKSIGTPNPIIINDNRKAFEIKSDDKLVTGYFSKKHMHILERILGPRIEYSISSTNRNESADVLRATSEKGKGYILGFNINK